MHAMDSRERWLHAINRPTIDECHILGMLEVEIVEYMIDEWTYPLIQQKL